MLKLARRMQKMWTHAFPELVIKHESMRLGRKPRSGTVNGIAFLAARAVRIGHAHWQLLQGWVDTFEGKATTDWEVDGMERTF